MVRTRIASAAALLFALGLLQQAVAQDGLPSSVPAGLEARQVGGGLLTWFGFEIYHASLWTPDGRFSTNDLSESGTQPVALSLWYRRSFDRDRLIQITRKGWREFGLASEEQQDRWAVQLRAIWVDVHAGSNMTAWVQPGGETRFYDAGRLLGAIEDPAFGPAFLRIWLDDCTRGTPLEDLRAALLGVGRTGANTTCAANSCE